VAALGISRRGMANRKILRDKNTVKTVSI